MATQSSGVPPKAIEAPVCSNPQVSSPDGRWLVTQDHMNAARDDAIRVWDLTTGELKATLVEKPRRRQFPVFSPDGAWIAVQSYEPGRGFIEIVETKKFTTTKRLPMIVPATDGPRMAFNRTGTLLATNEGGAVTLWEVTTGEVLIRLTDFGTIHAVAFSPTADMLAVEEGVRSLQLENRWLLDSRIVLVDLDPQSPTYLKRLREWDAPDNGLTNTIEFTPDGTRLIFNRRMDARLGTVVVDVQKGNTIHELTAGIAYHETFLCPVSSDGNTLVTVPHSAEGNRACVWNLATGKLERSFPIAANEGLSVALTPSGRVLAAGGSHATRLRFYDPATGQELVPGSARNEAQTPPLPFAPFTDADIQHIAALPTTELVEAVRQELKRRNPDYKGAIELIVENERVTKLVLQAPGIRDLSPARALPDLEYLECSGSPTLEDLRTLQGSPLRMLSIRNSGVSDLSPLQGLKLKGLECTGMSKLTDLSPLQGLPLIGLSIAYTPVQDLSPLRGLSLTELNCESTAVSDLSPLAGMSLVEINFRGTAVKNISALQSMPLTKVACDFNHNRDAQVLRGIKTLQIINNQPAAEFWKAVSVVPLTAAEIQRIAALPAAEQIETVRTELRKRNPNFDGKLTPTVENDVVTGLEFFTQQVTDISPVRALTRLTSLNCRGDGAELGTLSDLRPLQGMQLAKLTLSVNPISDLTPLGGMPLTDLHIDNSRVTDLTPLAGMPLRVLNCSYTKVANLAPLKDSPLFILWCNNTEVSDLTPLQKKSLEWITFQGTKVTDITVLKDMPLTQIYLDFVPERDREKLQALPNLQKINDLPPAEFWKRFAAKPRE